MTHTRAGRAFSAAAAVVCVAIVAGAGDARAHPHVWVTTETTVLYDNGTIVGLRQKWSFDEFYTSMALQGLDANNDGVYDRSELSELAKVNMDGLKEFDFFTTIKLSTEKLKVAPPKDFWLEHADAPEGQTQITVTTGDAAFEGTGAEENKTGTPPKPPGFFARLWTSLFGGSEEKTEAKPTTPPARPKVLSLHFTLPLAQPVLAEAQGFTFTIADPSFFIAFEPAAKDPVMLGEGAPAGCRIAIGEIPDATESPAAPPASPPAADATPDTTPGANPATSAEAPSDAANPAADASRLGEAFGQQFGEQTVAFGFVRPATISCGPRS